MHVNFITLLKQLVTETERGQSADHLLLGDKGTQSLNPGEVTLVDQIGKRLADRNGRDIIFLFQHGLAVDLIARFQLAGFNGGDDILFDLEILGNLVLHFTSLLSLTY